jgi:hypothetical protein
VKTYFELKRLNSFINNDDDYSSATCLEEFPSRQKRSKLVDAPISFSTARHGSSCPFWRRTFGGHVETSKEVGSISMAGGEIESTPDNGIAGLGVVVGPRALHVYFSSLIPLILVL